MKLLGVMGLEVFREEIRALFEGQAIEIYSELDITGHSAQSIEQFGWWHQDKDVPAYSTLFFAILPQEKAEGVLQELKSWSPEEHYHHVPRAFVLPVDKMV